MCDDTICLSNVSHNWNQAGSYAQMWSLEVAYGEVVIHKSRHAQEDKQWSISLPDGESHTASGKFSIEQVKILAVLLYKESLQAELRNM